MSTREIVTLQIGHYANFVGTHLWNLQSSTYSNSDNAASSDAIKEINFDVTFREGKTLTGDVTYTPRAIFFDLKGSLNTLKQDGVLYELPTSLQQPNWTRNVSLHEFSSAQKNDFLLHLEKEEATQRDLSHNSINSEKDEDTTEAVQSSDTGATPEIFNLNSVVNVWSDYLKPHLHHKTINILTEQNHADADSFNLFSLGTEVCKKQMPEVEDRLHFFTEECDNLQGFHLLVDAHDGFSGFAGQLYEEYISDEFNNKSCFVINTIPSTFKSDANKCAISMLNMLLSNDVLSACSGILPLSTETSMLYNAPKSRSSAAFPFLDYNPTLPYHTSAILASVLDNLSLPYRLADCVSHLGHHISSLTNDGRKILGLQASLPFATEDKNSLYDSLISYSSQPNASIFPEFSTLTPGLTKDGKVSLQNVTTSGLTDERLFGAKADAAKLKYSGAEDLVQSYFSRAFNTRMNNVHLIKASSHICEPYPHIFKKKSGHLPSIKRPRPESSNYPNSAPVATVLQNSTGVVGHLQEILNGVKKIQKNRIECYLNEVMQMDDFNDKVDQFRSLIDIYNDNQPDMI